MMRRGFTLLELAVVVAVLGMALTVALPLIDVGGMRVSATERELMMTLMNAQQLAVVRQHDVHVLFDTAASRVVLHEDRDGDGEREAGERERLVTLEEGVRFQITGVPAGAAGAAAVSFDAPPGGLPTLTYHRNGSTSEAGGFYIGTERSADGRRRSDARMLLVQRATGRVTRFYLDAGSWRAGGS